MVASPYGSTKISLARIAPGLALLGWHWSWLYWDWHQDGLAGASISKTPLRLVLLGLASL